jgi:hypothetical protein
LEESNVLKRSSLTLIIFAFTVVVLQILDLSAGATWARNWQDPSVLPRTLLYFTIVTASIFLQLYFLVITLRVSLKSKKRVSRLALTISYTYMAIQLAVIILLIYLLAEQILTYQYHIIISDLILGLVLLTSVAILILLSYTCIKAYLTKKNIMTVVFGIAMITLSVQLISAFFYIEGNFYIKPDIITTKRNPWISSVHTEFLSILFEIYNTAHLVSFIAVWVASVIFTKSLLQKIGKIKYWTIVTIPVIYFLLQYLPLLLNQVGLLTPLLMAKEPIFLYFYSFVINTINVGAGLLFGISFFILSMNLAHSHLRYYLIMCGAGIMVVFSSNISTVLVMTMFPAWAVVSLSFVLPASFMILIGLDSSAFFIAGDFRVRELLHKSRKEFELFKALGSSEFSSAIERKVRLIANQIYDNPENEPLFVSRSESEDISQYVSEVITEMKEYGGRRNNKK